MALTCALRCDGTCASHSVQLKRKRVTLRGAVSLCVHPAGEERICEHYWLILNLLRRAAYDDVTVVALFATAEFVSNCEQLNSVQNSA